MTNHQTLKRAAAEAHKLNWTWDRFWQLHADAIRRAEPYSRQRYHRLVQRLLALVVSGDNDGQTPVGDDDTTPWVVDDQQHPQPHDTITRARCLLALAPMPEGKRGNNTVAIEVSPDSQ